MIFFSRLPSLILLFFRSHVLEIYPAYIDYGWNLFYCLNWVSFEILFFNLLIFEFIGR